MSLSEICRCCIFYRNSLPLKALGIQYLQEWINFEYFDSEVFTNNFELNIYTATANNTILTVALGDFNAKSNLWLSDKKTNRGSKIDGITSIFGLQQIINEPTHITVDSSSCIDLIFTSETNLLKESNCHHQITYA